MLECPSATVQLSIRTEARMGHWQFREKRERTKAPRPFGLPTVYDPRTDPRLIVLWMIICEQRGSGSGVDEFAEEAEQIVGGN